MLEKVATVPRFLGAELRLENKEWTGIANPDSDTNRMMIRISKNPSSNQILLSMNGFYRSSVVAPYEGMVINFSTNGTFLSIRGNFTEEVRPQQMEKEMKNFLRNQEAAAWLRQNFDLSPRTLLREVGEVIHWPGHMRTGPSTPSVAAKKAARA